MTTTKNRKRCKPGRAVPFWRSQGPGTSPQRVKKEPQPARRGPTIAGNGIEQIRAFLKEHRPKAQDLTLEEKNLCARTAERIVDGKWQLNLDERKTVLSRLARKYGTCRFKLEGARFTVLNVQTSLDRFEKNFRGDLRKPSKTARAPRIRTGYLAGPGVRYYLPYTPRNCGLQDMDAMSDGWLTDRAIAIKAKPLDGVSYKPIEPDIGKYVRKQKRSSTWKPARIKGLTLYADSERDEGVPCVHVQAGRVHYLYKARYLDMIFTMYPDAAMLLSQDGHLIFQTRSIVAIAMPLRGACGKKAGTFESLPESVRDLLRKPEKPKPMKA